MEGKKGFCFASTFLSNIKQRLPFHCFTANICCKKKAFFFAKNKSEEESKNQKCLFLPFSVRFFFFGLSFSLNYKNEGHFFWPEILHMALFVFVFLLGSWWRCFMCPSFHLFVLNNQVSLKNECSTSSLKKNLFFLVWLRLYLDVKPGETNALPLFNLPFILWRVQNPKVAMSCPQ